MFFNETIEKEFLAYVDKVLEFGGTSSDQDIERLGENINLLYDKLNMNPPQIIFCDGPMQQVIFPALVGLMFKNGRENSATPRFVPDPLDDRVIRHEWQNLWKEAFSFIDWNEPTEFNDGVGALLNKRIRRFTERTLRSQLTIQVDEQLGVEQTENLENKFLIEIRQPLQSLRTLMPGGIEKRNHWSNFVYRLPGSFIPKLDVDHGDLDRELPISKDGPKDATWLGAADWEWVYCYDFARKHIECDLELATDRMLTLFLELSLSATAYLFCEHCCFVFSKPQEVSFDDQWRLHNSQKPAVDFLDGTRIFYWHGVEVDERVITNPRSLNIKEIENERNIELRRIMIERYGLGNFIRDSAAKKISEDECGVLYRKDNSPDEPIVVVKVYNSTLEPDGSSKAYFIRVPPRTRTAREGVAWSFHLGETQYKPKLET